MKRILAIATLSIALLTGGVAWDRYFGAPPEEAVALPEALIALDSAEGQRLLFESSTVRSDYAPLRGHFVPQSRRAYCGVATSVITLNALRDHGVRLNQTTFFNPAASRVRHPLRVSLSGMSLSQLGNLLHAHGAQATVIHAAQSSIDAFRSTARNNLGTPGDFLLVNYQRAELGQGEIGHISPLGAYNERTDRFLILDVAAHKYPPVWVSTKDLWNAMRAPIGGSPDRTRGFIAVREGSGGSSTGHHVTQ